MIIGLVTRVGAAAILSTMSFAIYHAIITAGFNIYLLELLALYFASAFSIILLGPGMFSADYLIKEMIKINPNLIKSISNMKSLKNQESSSKIEYSKSINDKNIFEFPFSSFLSS